MKNVMQIFIQDMKNIARTPSVLVLMVGLAILPSFYAWFNISAMWDPYSNTSGVKIAVVSDDVGAEVQGEEVNIGDQLVEQLKENDSLGWEFEDDRASADDKVYKGEYYASLYIPESFSEETVSIINNREPKVAEVTYLVNEKINAIAPKMTDTGATQITETINDEFVQATSSALFQEFDKVGLELENSLPQMVEIKDAVYSLYNSLDDIDEAADMIVEMDNNSDTIEGYANRIHEIGQYEGQVREAGSQVLTAQSYMGEVDRASQLILDLNNAMPGIEGSINQVSALQNYFPAINQGISDAYDLSVNAEGMINDIQNQIPTITQTIEGYQNQLDDISDTADDAGVILSDIESRVNSEVDSALNIINGLPDVSNIDASEVNAVTNSVQDAQNRLSGLKNDVGGSIPSTSDLNSTLDSAIGAGNTVLDVLNNLPASEGGDGTDAPDDEAASGESNDGSSSEASDSQEPEENNSEEGSEDEPGEGSEADTEAEDTQPPAPSETVGSSELDAALNDFRTAVENVKNENENTDWSQAEASEDSDAESSAETDEAESTEEEAGENDSEGESDASAEEAIDEEMSRLIDNTSQVFEEINNALNHNIDVIEHNINMLPQFIAMLDNPETESDGQEGIESIRESIEETVKTLENIQEMLNEIEEFTSSDEFDGIISTIDGHIDSLNEIRGYLDENDITLESVADVRDSAVEDLEAIQDFTNNTLDPFISEGFATLETQLSEADNKLETALGYTSTVGSYLSTAQNVTSTMQGYLSAANEQLPYYEQQFSSTINTVEYYFPQFQNAVSTANTFMQNDLPSIQSELGNLANFVENDMDGLLETYNNMDQKIQDNLPGALDEINTAAEFVRNDWPEYRQNIIDAYEKVHEIEENDMINELISALRNDLDESAEYFSRPVSLNEEKLFPIPNYGSASGPFYTALALWVGGLLMGNLLTTNLKNEDAEKGYSIRQIYLGRMMLFLMLSVIQALIVSLGNIFIIGAYVAHPWWFVLFTVLIGIIFNIIIYTLVSLFDNVGKAMVMLFMIIQLSGGGGTFPVEVLPEFFQNIHPFLPFTYAIDILREATGGIIWSVVIEKTLYLLIFPVVFLIFGYTLRPKISPIIHKIYKKNAKSNLIE